MNAWLSAHTRAFGRTFANLGRAPLATLLNVLVMGIALSLPLSLYVGLDNLQGFAREWPGEPELSMFLAVDAASADVGEVESRLRGRSDIASFRFIPKARALAGLKEAAGLTEVIDSLERNPLPDAFVVRPRAGAPETLEALRVEMAQWPRVERVQLDSDWARKLDAAVRLGRLVVAILGVILGIAMVVVAFNTIRLQILTRRDEIEVSSLIGATRSFVRRPFLYFGLLLGLLGGLTAWAIVATSLLFLNQGLQELAALYGGGLVLGHVDRRDLLVLLAISGLLGWLGAWLSTTRHLSEMEPR